MGAVNKDLTHTGGVGGHSISVGASELAYSRQEHDTANASSTRKVIIHKQSSNIYEDITSPSIQGLPTPLVPSLQGRLSKARLAPLGGGTHAAGSSRRSKSQLAQAVDATTAATNTSRSPGLLPFVMDSARQRSPRVKPLVPQIVRMPPFQIEDMVGKGGSKERGAAVEDGSTRR